MKNIINNFTILGLIIFFMSNCSKTDYGDAIFWQQTGSGFGITVVEINGVTSNISSEFNFPPDCGSSGCAVFNNLETGTYNFSASDGTNNWAGAITVSEGCLKKELD